jgi:hypothetical protein
MYYVYQHVRSDTKAPFYVGKGTGKRAHDMERHNFHHRRFQRELYECGAEIVVEIVALILALQGQPAQYNGDDYMRPDIGTRREEHQEERQEERHWQEYRWLRQQEYRQRWLDESRKP